MSLANQKASISYQEAVEATEGIETPALGFIRPSDYKTGATSLSSAIIKQNNTLLYLLIAQAQKLEEIKEEIEKLKRNLTTLEKRESAPLNLEDSIDSLTKRIDNLSLTKKNPVGGKQGPIYVFKDPNKIFKEEYEKELQPKRR
ncbi:ORF2 [Yacon necrotic mottle virus]|uniref:ORF2 n=1 Tax=Yacon necrotic mottle virus TaxID=1561150 RepID=A0A0C4N0T8_9VIRU|nr:ORF2 [Yacon necrotic mottle virus]AIT58608.1 ORF2 [Yacon necrotic mottle virus]